MQISKGNWISVDSHLEIRGFPVKSTNVPQIPRKIHKKGQGRVIK